MCILFDDVISTWRIVLFFMSKRLLVTNAAVGRRCRERGWIVDAWRTHCTFPVGLVDVMLLDEMIHNVLFL